MAANEDLADSVCEGESNHCFKSFFVEMAPIAPNYQGKIWQKGAFLQSRREKGLDEVFDVVFLASFGAEFAESTRPGLLSWERLCWDYLELD